MAATSSTDLVCLDNKTIANSSSNFTPNLEDMPNEVTEKIVDYLPMSKRQVLLNLENIRLQNIIESLHAYKNNTIVNLISDGQAPTYEPKSLELTWKAIKQSFRAELWHLTAVGLEQQRPSLPARQQHWTTLKVDKEVKYLNNGDKIAQAKVASQLEPEFTCLPASAFTHLQVRYMTFVMDGLPYVGALLKRFPLSPPTLSFQLLISRSNVSELLVDLLMCFFTLKGEGERVHSNVSRTLRHLSIFVSIESNTWNLEDERDCVKLMTSGQYQFTYVEELLLGGLRPFIVKYLLGYSFPALRRLVVLTRKEESATVNDFVEHFSIIPPEVRQQITHLAVRSIKSFRQALKKPAEFLPNDPLLVEYVRVNFPAVASFNGQAV